jgi:hypothetical protein
MTERARIVTERDINCLVFIAEMYGVQLDQLEVLLGVPPVRTRRIADRWRENGYIDSGRFGSGPPWIWVTRQGLVACGLRYAAVPPPLSRLAHVRAVTAVRLALAATAVYRQAPAYWRAERRLRARSSIGARDHLPDGEVHWPEAAPLPPEASPKIPWAGECWAVEVELTRKTVTRTVEIMRDLLIRTGDYGCPAADAAVPGRPPRHARVLYVCSPAARPTVTRARAELGPLAARIEIRDLPAEAAVPVSSRPDETGARPDETGARPDETGARQGVRSARPDETDAG